MPRRLAGVYWIDKFRDGSYAIIGFACLMGAMQRIPPAPCQHPPHIYIKLVGTSTIHVAPSHLKDDNADCPGPRAQCH